MDKFDPSGIVAQNICFGNKTMDLCAQERFYALGLRVNKRVLTHKIGQFRVTLRDFTP
jgi:hypothetical protein